MMALSHGPILVTTYIRLCSAAGGAQLGGRFGGTCLNCQALQLHRTQCWKPSNPIYLVGGAHTCICTSFPRSVSACCWLLGIALLNFKEP